MGIGSSKNSSEDTAQTYLTQQFSGTCNVTCENIQSGGETDIDHSLIIGGISDQQTCSTDSTCLISSNMNATSDVLFKAAQAASAGGSGGILPYWWTGPQIDITTNTSRQDIQTYISQSSNETCNMSSYNGMEDITLNVTDSIVIGGISTDQVASTGGECVLDNTMLAAAYSTGLTDQTAVSGKDKKGQKMGALSGILRIMAFLVIGLVVIAVVGLSAYLLANMSKKKGKTDPVQPPPGIPGQPGMYQPGQPGMYQPGITQFGPSTGTQMYMTGPPQKFTM